MEGTIAEINLFAGNFAPRNWAYCQGQTISIASNTALFSLLGTTYGGNGQTNFQLPNLAGRVAIGTGAGPGLTNRQLGEMGGSTTTTLTVANLPVHTHGIQTVVQVHANGSADGDDPANAFWGQSSEAIYGSKTDTQLAADAVVVNTSLTNTGANAAFTNMQPYLAMNYVICLFGIYPYRG